MNDQARPAKITILDKEYLINCSDDEREQLHSAAQLLNVKMKELKDSGKVIGAERIAVITALNLAHELLAYKQENDVYNSNIDYAIQRLQSKIDNALMKGRQFEIS